MHKNITLILIIVAMLFFFFPPVLLLAESNAEKYKNKGNLYYKGKKYDQAIREYTHALIEDMDYSEAYYNRGLVYYDKNLFYKSIVDFDMAIMLNPNDKAAYYGRGLAYSRVGKTGLALADIKKADKLGDPDARKLLKSGLLTRRIEINQKKNKKIESLLGNDANDYNRKTKINSRNNEFGGNTVLTIHSKGDPFYDGKDGIFKTIKFFNSKNILKKKELLHTAVFNNNNGRNRTIIWYDEALKIQKKEFRYTGKMLNIKGIHYYDQDGKIIKKALYDKHGKEIVRK